MNFGKYKYVSSNSDGAWRLFVFSDEVALQVCLSNVKRVSESFGELKIARFYFCEII